MMGYIGKIVINCGEVDCGNCACLIGIGKTTTCSLFNCFMCGGRKRIKECLETFKPEILEENKDE